MKNAKVKVIPFPQRSQSWLRFKIFLVASFLTLSTITLIMVSKSHGQESNGTMVRLMFQQAGIVPGRTVTDLNGQTWRFDSVHTETISKGPGRVEIITRASAHRM